MHSSNGNKPEAGRRRLTHLFRLGKLLYQATMAKPLFRESFFAAGLFCALVAVMQIGLVPPQVAVVVGRPAERTILAPREVEDPF
ncbi:MAG: hypothetical protein GX493_09700 [Firmicutes bacterium]|nr:hypothetical protein [Bacillota bacterium]